MRPALTAPGWLAVLAAAAGVAGCGGGDRSAEAADQRPLRSFSPPKVAPGTENQLLAERQWLDRIGTSAIGEAYACASVLPRRRPWRVPEMSFVVFVSDEAAKLRARALASKLSAPTRIGKVSPRWRMTELRRIRREAEATHPEAAALAIETIPFMDLKRGCPPIEIAFVEGEPGAAVAEQWAADLQARHGSDRVKVKRLEPPRPQVAEWSLARNARMDDKSLSLLVRERACASGRSPEGRIGTAVRYGRDAITVTVRVRPLAGAQTCQGNPPTPLTLSLEEAVGERRIVDGARHVDSRHGRG